MKCIKDLYIVCLKMNREKYTEFVSLKNKIDKLPKESHVEILKIIQKHNTNFTENNNGIFVNMIDMSPVVLFEINTFVNYLNIQNHEIKEFETKKSEIELLL